MNRLAIFQSMMTLTVICGLLMAYWLAKNQHEQKGLKPLAGFNLFMALWCLGHLSLSFDFPALGEVLLSLNPLMPTLFLHFALLFVCDKVTKGPWLCTVEKRMPLAYGFSTLVVFVSISFSGNRVEPWLDFPWFLKLGDIGWINLLYTVFIGLLAHGVLLWGYAKSQGNTRKSILMMFIVGGWGFTLASSYILASLELNHYPYLLWLVPSYLLLLSFAVLRYQMLAVNYWAIKTLIWSAAVLLLLGLTTLLTSIASPLGLPHLAEVPLSVLWLYSVITGLMLWLLYKPLHRIASALVYPDVHLTEQIIDSWLARLSQCHSFSELSDVAGEIIASHIRQPVTVAINRPDTSDGLSIHCFKHNEQWQFELNHWQDVTPGIRHSADIFASLLYTSCTNLDKSLLLAQQEQQRQEELRLVELGSLAAAMAHELRNPLNIISMASAQCEDKVKGHIQGQLSRADALIQDLLSYARVMEINCQQIQLLPLITTLANSITEQFNVPVEIRAEEHIRIWADPYKLQQVLVNCLENAGSFCQNQHGATILIECTDNPNGVTITIHNSGPAIAKQYQQELFKPFISKRPGGSGLGLAIVQRIMHAHEGSISFSEQLGWNVSFVCHFPHKPRSAL